MNILNIEGTEPAIAALHKEKWCSVSGSVVSLCVLAHSWRLHGRRKWKRMRIYTEVSAASTVVCAVLLWAGYTMSKDSWWRAILVNTLAMSLFFVPSQYADNVTFYECAESVGGKIRNRALRHTVFAVIFGILFAWFPIYFLRGFVPSWYDKPSDLGARLMAWTYYYYAPACFTYNSVFGVFFIHRLFAMPRVKSSSEGRLFVLVLKTVIRVIVSTGAVVFETFGEQIGSEIEGSLVYMVVTTLSIHVLFNARIDGAMEKWLFKNYAFFQEEMRHISKAITSRTHSAQKTTTTISPRKTSLTRLEFMAECIPHSPPGKGEETPGRREAIIHAVKEGLADASAGEEEDSDHKRDASPKRLQHCDRQNSCRPSNSISHHKNSSRVHPLPHSSDPHSHGTQPAPLPPPVQPEGVATGTQPSPRRETAHQRWDPRTKLLPVSAEPAKDAK